MSHSLQDPYTLYCIYSVIDIILILSADHEKVLGDFLDEIDDPATTGVKRATSNGSSNWSSNEVRMLLLEFARKGGKGKFHHFLFIKMCSYDQNNPLMTLLSLQKVSGMSF